MTFKTGDRVRLTGKVGTKFEGEVHEFIYQSVSDYTIYHRSNTGNAWLKENFRAELLAPAKPPKPPLPTKKFALVEVTRFESYGSYEHHIGLWVLIGRLWRHVGERNHADNDFFKQNLDYRVIFEGVDE